jgi:hypothetical protein
MRGDLERPPPSAVGCESVGALPQVAIEKAVEAQTHTASQPGLQRGNVISLPRRRATPIAPATRSLSDWERRYLSSLSRWPLPLLPGQCAWLRAIADRGRH